MADKISNHSEAIDYFDRRMKDLAFEMKDSVELFVSRKYKERVGMTTTEEMLNEWISTGVKRWVAEKLTAIFY